MKLIEFCKQVTNNIKTLNTSQTTMLLTIFIPLILVLLIGVSLNQSGAITLEVGYVNSDNTSASYISAFSLEELSLKELRDDAQCINSVKFNLIHACIVFAGNNESADVNLYVNSDNLNTVRPLLSSLLGASTSANFDVTVLNDISKLTDDLSTQKTEISQLDVQLDAVRKQVKGFASDSDSDSDSSDSSVSIELENFSASRDILQQEIDMLVLAATESIEESFDLIDDVDDEVDASSITSSEKDEIEDLLKDAKNDLEDFEDNVTDTSKNLTQLLETLSNDLEETQKTLTYLSSKSSGSTTSSDSSGIPSAQVDPVVAKIDELKTKLGEVSVALDGLKGIAQNIKAPEVKTQASLPHRLNSVATAGGAGILHNVYIFVLILVTILLSATLAHERSNQINILKTANIFYEQLLEFFATCLLFNLVVTIIIFIIFSIFSSSVFISHIFSVLIPLLFITAVFSALGTLIAVVIKDHTALLFASLSIFSVLAFFSDFILPTSYVSKTITVLNPYVVATNIMRNAVLLETSYGILNIIMLLIYLVVFVGLLLLILFKYREQFQTSPHRDEHGNDLEYDEPQGDDQVIREAPLKSAEDVIERLEQIGEEELLGGGADGLGSEVLSVEEYKTLQKVLDKAGDKVKRLLGQDKKSKKKSSKGKKDKATADNLVERLKIEAEIVELVKKKDYTKRELKKELSDRYEAEDIDAVFKELF